MTAPTWAIDQEGRIFFEGRWVATAEAKEAGPAYVTAKTAIRIAAVRPKADSKAWVEDPDFRRRFEEAGAVSTSFSTYTVPLDEIEAVNAAHAEASDG